MKNEDRYVISMSEAGGWDALVQRFPDCTVFHTSPWLDSLAAVTGAKPLLLRATVDGDCVGVWPVLVLRKAVLRILGSPLPGWSTPYLGPLFAPEADVPAVLRAFLAHPALRRHAFFACRVLDRRRPVDLGALGFSQVTRFETYRLSLTRDEEVLWSNLDPECRRLVRKAQKLGVVVSTEEDEGFMEPFWAMTVETFAKRGVAPAYSKELLLELWKRLHPVGGIEVCSAFLDGKRLGSQMMALDGRAAYGIALVSDQARIREIPSNQILLWETIRRVKAKGLEEFDFVSTLGGPGRFKRTFGPTAVHVATHWERCPNRLMRELRTWYERYLHHQRKVPRTPHGGAPGRESQGKTDPRSRDASRTV